MNNICLLIVNIIRNKKTFLLLGMLKIMGYDAQTIWFQQAFMLPVGVGICNKCLMYGYGPYNGRRSWDPKWIDERLHRTWYGCKEGEDGYMADRPSEKTMWPDPGDQKWKSFVYLRAWMNTFKAKAESGLITHGIKVPCAWYSSSQNVEYQVCMVCERW